MNLTKNIFLQSYIEVIVKYPVLLSLFTCRVSSFRRVFKQTKQSVYKNTTTAVQIGGDCLYFVDIGEIVDHHFLNFLSPAK